ncbi:unnamed protein product, partial [Coffea canephora]
MWGFRSSSTLANIFLLLFVAMIFSVSHVSASKQFKNETDRLALLEFKKQIYNDPLGVLNSWNHSQHHCQWEGVTCGTRHQRVIALTLRHKQLLRVLNLSSNAIGGKIPANLSYCSELVTISLFENKLEGKIPIDQLSNLKKLEYFNLRTNNLTGEIPSSIGNLSSLTGLAFSDNHVEGKLPVEMGLLKRLVQLFLGENKLSGKIPTSIFNSSAITVISVAGNSFHVMANLSNQLTKLFLGGNQLSGTIPEGFGNFVNLYLLSLEENYLSGVIPRDFGKLQNLQAFENSFTGSLPSEVGKLIHLVDFNVSHNQFSGDISMSLADCSDLENLFMQSNFFRGTVPPNMASCKSIQRLDLSSNNLTGPIPKEFEKLQFLRYLNLSYNDIEGEIPNTGVFSNASQISLIGNNKLCGGIPELELPPCPVIKGKNRGKLKVIILLSIVLPATLLVLGALLLYFLVYRKRERRLVAGFCSMPTRVDMLLRISYHELLRASSGFSSENLIAVKVLDLQKNGASKSFKAECKALRNIRHRNLISIVSYCSSIDSK